MAARLIAAGIPVSGFDIDESRLSAHVRAGGTTAPTAAEAGAADVVIVSLPSEASLAQAILGRDGVAKRIRAGSVLVETSTFPIAAKEEVRDRLHPLGVTVLDCPLSGTADQIITGDVVVLASGERAAVERCSAIFAAFARSYHYLGEFGAGSRLKFVANLLVGIHNIAARRRWRSRGPPGLISRQRWRRCVTERVPHACSRCAARR